MHRYSDYDKRICSENDLEKYVREFERELALKRKELDDFMDRAKKRLEWIKECEENKTYHILGRTYRDGKNKEILLIIRYPDGSQRDERYSYTKIKEIREKLDELKERYSGVDWSDFEHEI